LRVSGVVSQQISNLGDRRRASWPVAVIATPIERAGRIRSESAK
jgi:hypothetical protein